MYVAVSSYQSHSYNKHQPLYSDESLIIQCYATLCDLSELQWPNKLPVAYAVVFHSYHAHTTCIQVHEISAPYTYPPNLEEVCNNNITLCEFNLVCKGNTEEYHTLGPLKCVLISRVSLRMVPLYICNSCQEQDSA